jgi:hypothetical protein
MGSESTILSVVMLVIIFISLITGSYKSGYIAFSGQSIFNRDRPRFEVDKAKIELFAVSICSSLLVNTIFALIVTRGDIATALFFAAFNTLALSYALVYWILLKEKKAK